MQETNLLYRPPAIAKDYVLYTEAEPITGFVGIDEQSLWTGSLKPIERHLPTDRLPVVRVIGSMMLGLTAMTLQIESEEVTKPLATGAVQELARGGVRRGSKPVAQSPGAFSADDDLADLQSLRQRHGENFGQAKFPGRKVPISAS